MASLRRRHLLSCPASGSRVQWLRAGEPTDFDVYDAVDSSVGVALSERSVAEKSHPVDFPDFTRSAWKTRTALGIVEAPA